MINIKAFENYTNTQNELDLIRLRLKIIEEYTSLLENEKKDISIFEKKLIEYLNQMNIDLKELSGIENKLYYEIIVNGLNVTKAVDKVAFDHDKEVSTIWKYYYPKVKEKIEKIRAIEKNEE